MLGGGYDCVLPFPVSSLLQLHHAFRLSGPSRHKQGLANVANVANVANAL